MEDLRMLMKLKRIRGWKVAEAIGISEPTFYRWMRTYNPEHHEIILGAINQLSGGEVDE